MDKRSYSIKSRNEEPPETLDLVKRKYLDFVFPKSYELMCELKSKIDEKENSKLWDKAKRKVNPYEMVNIIGTNILISEKGLKKSEKRYDYSPLSRAFFKMTEIYNDVGLLPNNYKTKEGVIANIAEGPGGFIESIFKQRKASGYTDTYYGITLKSKNKNIPGWSQLKRRKTHFLNNSKVTLLTGNLYNTNTILHYSKFFRTKKAFIVTCDGGFDYSNDFNNQEKNSRKIIYAEIITTLLIQEIDGNMVCKIFDFFTYFSLQLIYLLTLLYKEVRIIKPVTSRPANSEKYIVAKGFKGVSHSLVMSMISHLANWDENYMEDSLFDSTNIPNGILFNNLILPDDFINEIKKANDILVEFQKEYINKTLDYIKNNTKIDDTVQEQYKYSKLWFDKYKILNNKEI